MSMATTVPVKTMLPRKTLVLIGGNAGIGKSSAAKSLAVSTVLPLLDKDTLLAPFLTRAAEDEEGADISTDKYANALQNLNDPAYDALLSLADTITVHSLGCIAVAPFSGFFENSPDGDSHQNPRMAAVSKLAVKNNYRVVSAWLHLSDAEEHESRMRKRGWILDENKLKDFSAWRASQLSADDVGANADVIVDLAEKTPRDAAQVIAERLR